MLNVCSHFQGYLTVVQQTFLHRSNRFYLQKNMFKLPLLKILSIYCFPKSGQIFRKFAAQQFLVRHCEAFISLENAGQCLSF